MPRKKNWPGRGRPGRSLPPRIDATMEELARAMMEKPTEYQYQNDKGEGKVYQCERCKRAVSFPETLYQDGLCETCHGAVA